MPIFRYTAKKILRSPSTWVIIAITTVLLTALTVLILAISKSSIGPGQTTFVWTKELVLKAFLYNWKTIIFFILISMMLLVFIAVKATQIFRDEMDDGTLLILISKPISRTRIWTEKWLSLQSSIIFFLLISILISSLALIFPFTGGASIVFTTMFPYLLKLFGVAILFEVIFSSIALLLTMIINGKAVVAILIGFSAALNIFGSSFFEDVIFPIDGDYYQVAHAYEVYQVVENKLNKTEMVGFNDLFNLYQEKITDEEGKVIGTQFDKQINDLLTSVYKIDPKSANDPIEEQKLFSDIYHHPTNPKYKNLTPQQITLVTELVPVVNVFRVIDNQGYQGIIGFIGFNTYDSRYYSIEALFTQLDLKFSKNTIDTWNKQVRNKTIFRYFNVFYQLNYLWKGSFDGRFNVFEPDWSYKSNSDPAIVKFEQDASNKYVLNLTTKSHKMINFYGLLVVYSILGTISVAGSWYIFNRRDFA